MATIEEIKQLREETGVSVTKCKEALDESNGDFEKAKDVLRKLGNTLASKRTDKETGAGLIHTYLHPNKRVGVMLELRCETDFVANSNDFENLAHELCLQIAAMKPLFVSEEEIPSDILEKEKAIYLEQAKQSGKPENILKGIVDGKLNKYKESSCLISQPCIKDDKKKIKDFIDEVVAKIGEKIIIKQFTRYEI